MVMVMLGVALVGVEVEVGRRGVSEKALVVVVLLMLLALGLVLFEMVGE